MTTSDKSDDAPTPPSVVAAVGATLGAVTASATADVRRNFSTPHLKAAQHFADELRRHEDAHVGAGWGPHVEFCRWYATAAIILSFSAIEAAIDEAEDDLGLPLAVTKGMERKPTLDHAQELLAHRGSRTFVKGAEPFQSVDLLQDLRNGLVHPRAEWDSARDRNQKLSKRVTSARLPLSPFQPDQDLGFPHGCMSSGVGNWAASSAREFIREMRSRLGLRPTV